MARNLVAAGIIASALVALWLFPLVFFANPGTNDAIWLSNLELLLILAVWGGPVVAVVRAGHRRSLVCVGLGVFLIGAAAALVLGLAVFGNMSDDRFLPLLFLPPALAIPGVVLIVMGVVLSNNRRELLRPAAYGAAAAVFIGAWILIRGSRDWLLAPYGFDELAAIVVVGAALVTLRPSLRG